jgi:uncharacterized protein (TIGR02118 family)
MIKISVMYPNSAGAEFDMRYYLDTHIALVKEKLGSACKGVQVEAGVSGAAPGAAAAYVCMGHLLFDSVEAYQQAFAPHVDAIMGDVKNYTNVEPVVQISEIKL